MDIPEIDSPRLRYDFTNGYINISCRDSSELRTATQILVDSGVSHGESGVSKRVLLGKGIIDPWRGIRRDNTNGVGYYSFYEPVTHTYDKTAQLFTLEDLIAEYSFNTPDIELSDTAAQAVDII